MKSATKPVVLLGGTGYVGSVLRVELDGRGTNYQLVTKRDCDYFDVESLFVTLKELDPSFLINAAGYTGRPNVDACEQNKLECLRLNAVLPGVIRQACERLDLAWGHVSTGCIFTGQKPGGGGFTEEDPPNFTFRQNNCSYYSGTKFIGEESLKGAPRCYIWRLRMPFSSVDEPRNYLSKLLAYDKLLDVRNSLSHLQEFARACLDCQGKQIEYGIYNLTNGGSMTTREIVRLMVQHGIAAKESFQFFASESEFMQNAAIAPRSACVLDNRKATRAGIRLRDVHEAVEADIRDWRTKNA